MIEPRIAPVLFRGHGADLLEICLCRPCGLRKRHTGNRTRLRSLSAIYVGTNRVTTVVNIMLKARHAAMSSVKRGICTNCVLMGCLSWLGFCLPALVGGICARLFQGLFETVFRGAPVPPDCGLRAERPGIVPAGYLGR